MANEVRTPKQQRSIETKNRIIQAGYRLFAEKGYFNTNTAEIAKQAGVSTGIVYGYFHDKKDILVDVLQIYAEDVFAPVLAMFDSLKPPICIPDMVDNVLDIAVEAHRNHASIHEALHSLSHLYPEVNDRFMQVEGEMTRRIVVCCRSLGYSDNALTERVHWAFESVQSYAHECVFDKHPYIDYDIMRTIQRKVLIAMFEKYV